MGSHRSTGLAGLKRSAGRPGREAAPLRSGIPTPYSSAAFVFIAMALVALFLLAGKPRVRRGSGWSPSRCAWRRILPLNRKPAGNGAAAAPAPAQAHFRDQGVPEEYRTAVVIPTLFESVEEVGEALSNLEVQYLANREAHLHFALLSDFKDSPTETRESDAGIMAAAEAGVRDLNARYAPESQDAFYLFHSPGGGTSARGVDGVNASAASCTSSTSFCAAVPATLTMVVGDVAAIRRCAT
jgi:hypothetical protein